MSISLADANANMSTPMSVDNNHSECIDNIPTAQSVGIEDSTPGGTRFWIPDVPVKPFEGMIFETLTKVYEFYKEYAKKGGFEIKKGGEYAPDKASPMRKYYYCSREGFKKKKADHVPNNPNAIVTVENERVEKETRRRPSIRCGCNAYLLVKKINGDQYAVDQFVEKHNHSLVHNSDVQFLRAHRQLTYTQKDLLHKISHANLGPVKGFKLLKHMYGSFSNIGATVDDCKNFRKDMQKFIGDRDAQMVVEKLMSKRDFNPGFSMDYLTDSSNKLIGLFWADEESKRSYFTFGDVVSFDATFNSNKYKMVFVPFTGIDNHNRCVTFGVGLISKEDLVSYNWLLESFLKAFGKPPKIVVTDQDLSMKSAIKEIFPNSRHRLCMWHIMQKLSMKVSHTIFNDESFKKRLCNIVWTDKISPKDFEDKWHSIIEDFGLDSNNWLAEIFSIRSSWIPAYYREEPLSGLMRTTSRSESENHFFGQLTNANLTLVEFMSHFETAMDVQRYNHSKHDQESRYTTPDFKTELSMEKHAAQIFTRTIFFDIQDEMHRALMNCHSYNVKDVDDFKMVEVHETKEESKKKKNDIDEPPVERKIQTYNVLFRESDVTVSCSCKRYESYGLLCRHAFLVLKMFHIKEFPSKYVLRRWTREALPPKSDASNNKVQQLSQNSAEADSTIRGIFYSVEYTINRLVGDLEKLSMYGDTLKEFMKQADSDVPIPYADDKNAMMGSMLGVTEPKKVNVENPEKSKNKGCGDHKRKKSGKEISMINSQKNLRTCGNCGKKEGHNIKTCPHKAVASSCWKDTKRSTSVALVKYCNAFKAPG